MRHVTQLAEGRAAVKSQRGTPSCFRPHSHPLSFSESLALSSAVADLPAAVVVDSPAPSSMDGLTGYVHARHRLACRRLTLRQHDPKTLDAKLEAAEQAPGDHSKDVSTHLARVLTCCLTLVVVAQIVRGRHQIEERSQEVRRVRFRWC